MKIFNLEIFGSDADYWLAQPTMWQVDWIKANTNQQNDELIDEFLSAVTKDEDKQCLNCGQNGNISKGIPEAVKSVTKSKSVKKLSK
jgi:hypothetical protein